MLNTSNTCQFKLDQAAHTLQSDIRALLHWKQLYLKRFLIQDPGAKNSYTIGVNTGTVTSAQGLG